MDGRAQPAAALLPDEPDEPDDVVDDEDDDEEELSFDDDPAPVAGAGESDEAAAFAGSLAFSVPDEPERLSVR